MNYNFMNLVTTVEVLKKHAAYVLCDPISGDLREPEQLNDLNFELYSALKSAARHLDNYVQLGLDLHELIQAVTVDCDE